MGIGRKEAAGAMWPPGTHSVLMDLRCKAAQVCYRPRIFHMY